MATMTDNDVTGPAPDDEEPGQPPEPAEDPGYLIETGDAVGDDGSVVPIIGGLPAVEGSSWDIGAPGKERGWELARELGDESREKPGRQPE
jgi:hypothetical protein